MFALALRRESLARLRDGPALRADAARRGNVAVTAIGRARSSRPRASASRSSGSTSSASRTTRRDTFVIDDGVHWRWTDEDAARADAARPRAL